MKKQIIKILIERKDDLWMKGWKDGWLNKLINEWAKGRMYE